jgi:hypothetical protein
MPTMKLKTVKTRLHRAFCLLPEWMTLDACVSTHMLSIFRDGSAYYFVTLGHPPFHTSCNSPHVSDWTWHWRMHIGIQVLPRSGYAWVHSACPHMPQTQMHAQLHKGYAWDHGARPHTPQTLVRAYLHVGAARVCMRSWRTPSHASNTGSCTFFACRCCKGMHEIMAHACKGKGMHEIMAHACKGLSLARSLLTHWCMHTVCIYTLQYQLTPIPHKNKHKKCWHRPCFCIQMFFPLSQKS